MPLVGSELLRTARAERHGVGAFNVIGIDHAEALVAAAEAAQLPVILQISENAAKYHAATGAPGLAPISRATAEIAAAASVPVVLHLDHAIDEALIDEALGLGFGSVMFDGAHLPDAENIERTAAVAQRAHAAGVWVEAELGEVGGKEHQPRSAHEPGVKTDPLQAKEFVELTGVDALAVAVGSQHAMTERSAALDTERIAAIADAVAVPLVLHGSSGVPDAEIVAGVAAGLTKINVSTHLNKVYTGAVRKYLADNPSVVDPRKYTTAARAAMRDETARLLRLIHG